MLSMNVVAAKPASPRGAGFAGVQPAVRPAYGSATGAGATSASRAPMFAASMYLLLLGVMDVAGKLKLREAQGNDRSLNGRVGTASGVQGTANGDRSEKPR